MRKNKKEKSFLKWSGLGWVVAIATLFWTIWWSIHTYNQLLPLNQANVIFLESSEITHSINDEVMLSGDMLTSFDRIEPLIKNIGKATARDIKFRIYAIYFDESIKFSSSNDSIEKYFNDQIIHDLPSETTASFGTINLSHSTESCGRNLVEEKQQIALVFCLQFIDSLTKENKNRFLFFQYSLGGSKFYSLIGADYWKVCDRLITKLEKEDRDEIDEKLLEFIKNKE